MNLNRFRNYLRCAVLGLLGVLVAIPAFSQDPFDMPDNTWITIDGTVKTVTRNAFTLDYGTDVVTVEMDDGDRDADAYKLISGDEVTVFGKVDNDFFEKTTIEARSVFVEKLGTFFFASARDENEKPWMFGDFSPPMMTSTTILRGVVTDTGLGEFTLNTGGSAITVDVSEMSYNPLDDEGYQRVDEGDRVWVSGEISHNLFSDRRFAAEVITIAQKNDKSGSAS